MSFEKRQSYDEFRNEAFKNLSEEQQEAVMTDANSHMEFLKRVESQWQDLLDEGFDWSDYTPNNEWKCCR